jgi:SAM-dependent methyltransferase
MTSQHGGWETGAPAYRHTINNPSGDSQYLRDHGLKPNILDLTRNENLNRVLDVGCGDCWLFDTLRPKSGVECDVVESPHPQREWPYSVEDITNLSFSDGSFDLVVASLVLMWIGDLPLACRELHRVAAEGASLVIAIMHPSFYRLGRVLENGDVLIEHDYGEERIISDLRIANQVGPFQYYHRPMNGYVNTLIESGWSLAEMREWSMDLEDYRRQFPTAKIDVMRRSGRLPMYAFLKCKKAAND